MVNLFSLARLLCCSALELMRFKSMLHIPSFSLQKQLSHGWIHFAEDTQTPQLPWPGQVTKVSTGKENRK